MADLAANTGTTQIEVALRDTIALALRRRYPAVANVAALRAWSTLGEGGSSSLDETNVELLPVGTTVYRWYATSTEHDDGAGVIAPADRVAARLPGRWLRTTAAADAGFLDAVRLYEGEDTEDMILQRVLGVIPSCLIIWRGEEHRLKSVQPGALYEFPVEFEVWISSKNMRRGNEALLGSPIADEADRDPGVLNAIGQLKKVLAGSNLGQPGVDFVELHGHTPKLQSLSEGEFVHALKITVRAAIHIPDDPGEDVPLEPGALWLQGQLVDSSEHFDPANHRVGGLEVDLGHTQVAGVPGKLFSLVHAGEVVMNGTSVATPEIVVELQPSHDHYRDVFPSGVVWLTPVPVDAAPPAQSVGTLRVGVSRTNATDVISDRFLVGSARDVGEPDLLPRD